MLLRTAPVWPPSAAGARGGVSQVGASARFRGAPGHALARVEDAEAPQEAERRLRLQPARSTAEAAQVRLHQRHEVVDDHHFVAVRRAPCGSANAGTRQCTSRASRSAGRTRAPVEEELHKGAALREEHANPRQQRVRLRRAGAAGGSACVSRGGCTHPLSHGWPAHRDDAAYDEDVPLKVCAVPAVQVAADVAAVQRDRRRRTQGGQQHRGDGSRARHSDTALPAKGRAAAPLCWRALGPPAILTREEELISCAAAGNDVSAFAGQPTPRPPLGPDALDGPPGDQRRTTMYFGKSPFQAVLLYTALRPDRIFHASQG